MRHLGFAILGVLFMASLFGCRASKNATEKSEVKTEITTSEKRDLQSEWERFIKNNLNITLEGVELEYEPLSVPLGSATTFDGETATETTCEPFLAGSSIAPTLVGKSAKGKGNKKAAPKVKMKIGKATINSNTEQLDNVVTTDKGEATSEVKQEERKDKKEVVKNPQNETLTALKWIAVLVLLIYAVSIMGKWLKKRGKI